MMVFIFTIWLKIKIKLNYEFHQNLRQSLKHVDLLSAVEQNKLLFTKNETKSATVARSLQQQMDLPSDKPFRRHIRTNNNFEIAEDNVLRAKRCMANQNHYLQG